MKIFVMKFALPPQKNGGNDGAMTEIKENLKTLKISPLEDDFTSNLA